MGDCVTWGTPSIALGTRTPCQWTVVVFFSGRSLVTMIRAWSPLRKRKTGPGTEPLKPQTSLRTPGRIDCEKALGRSLIVPFGGAVCANAGGRAIIERVAPVVLRMSRRENIT